MDTHKRTLSITMRGADVQGLHHDLTKLGYSIPADELTDQHFGPGTRLALSRFQQAHGLEETGLVDATTGRQLAEELARLNADAPTAAAELALMASTHVALEVPKARVFVVDETGQPRAGAALALFDDASSRVLAMLQSDHAGYAAFVVPPASAKESNLVNLRVRLLNAAGIDTRVSLESPAVLTVPSDIQLPSHSSWLPSVALPDSTDYAISPRSFAARSSAIVGVDGCETILPGAQAEHVYRIRQLLPDDDDGGPDGEQIRQGYILVYRVSWNPIGHALGDIVYSLPLAPAETVNLAVVDWSRQDMAARREDGTFDEQLAYSLARDRTIDETMTSALTERQTGGSVLGGAAGQYNGGEYTIAASVGGAYAESNATRDLSASTVQNVADRISQAGSAQRRLATSVIVQAAQAEQTSVATRSITNHNHCHTLTILYYQLLRQFHVVTEFEELIPVLLVPYQVDRIFTDERILAMQYLLEPRLLDPRLATGFDALADSLLPPPPQPADQPARVKSLRIAVTTGAVGGILKTLPDDCSVSLFLQLRDGNTRGHELRAAGGGTWLEGTQTVVWSVDPPVELASIDTVALEFANNQNKTVGDTSRSWSVTGLSISYVTTTNERGSLFSSDDVHWLPDTPRGGTSARWTSEPLASSSDTPATSLPEAGRRATQIAAAMLRNHIRANHVYYSRVLGLGTDPEERAISWLGVDYQGRPLLAQVENQAIGTFADRLAYRWTHPLGEKPFVPRTPREAWVSLPVRGVFAEAQLGHCNACEVIDDTRFWDWQKSPVQQAAPTIEGITAATRATSIIPSSGPQVPAPVLTIQAAPAAPDPSGLNAILTAITRPDIFRDMSGLKELSDLLQSLVAAVSGKKSGAKADSDHGSGSGDGGTSDSGHSSTTTSGGQTAEGGHQAGNANTSGNSSSGTAANGNPNSSARDAGDGSGRQAAAPSQGSGDAMDTPSRPTISRDLVYRIDFHDDGPPGNLSGTELDMVRAIATDINNNRRWLLSIDVDAEPDALPARSDLETARAVAIRDAIAAAVGVAADALPFHLHPQGGGRRFRVYVRLS